MNTNMYNNEELEAFLIEADLINQKVKALAQNRMSPEQFDHLQRLRQQDRNRREQAKIRKQQQLFNKKKLGCEGKGISKDFSHFCKACRWQYQLPTPQCWKCHRRTLNLQQRQKQLQIMVKDYKYKKKNRQQRKHKWEMWKKTQQSLWKKTSNNYSKWQYFVSDSQQQPQQQPILPKNDPNFKALQMDLQQRKKRKQKDQQQTKRLKDKGNKFMQQGNYQQAMHKYTLALQHAKDVKSVYTNRALAYIKLGKFKKAIKDCTNVIQYMEIFQKIGQNKDLTFKAYSRRALAKKEIRQYKQGLTDIQQALKLYPDDKNALLLKKQLQGLKNHSEKVQKILRENTINQQENNSQNQGKNVQNVQQDNQEKDQNNNQQMDQEAIRKQQRKIVKQLAEEQIQKQNQQNQKNVQNNQQSQKSAQNTSLNSNSQNPPKKIQKQLLPIQKIKKNISNLTAQTIKQTFEILIKNKQMKSIFIAGKGIQACLKSLLNEQFSREQALLISLCLQNDGVGQKAVMDFGIDKIHNRIQQLLNDTLNQKQHSYQIMQDLFEILIAVSLYQPYRIKISSDHKVHSFIQSSYTKLISKRNNRTHLLNLFVIYMSNLLSGSDSGLKNYYFTKQKFTTLMDSFFVLILDQKTQNRTFLDLKKNTIGLLANMATHIQHRKTIIEFFINNNKFDQLSLQLQQYPKSMHNFTEYIESILSLLVNTTFETNLENKQLSQILFNRFIKFQKIFSKQIIYRSFIILSRLKHQNINNQICKKWFQIFQQISQQQQPLKNPQQKCNMIQIVKLLNIIYGHKQGSYSINIALPKKLYNVLCEYVSNNLVHQNLFCNTANLFGLIAMSSNQFKQQIYQFVSINMKQLVYISKDKIGNWRKNAAILIAKCSSNPKVKQAMARQHAMDVLKTIAHLINAK